MTRRRWIADTWTKTTATLTGEQADHLARVLRATPGQVYDVAWSALPRHTEKTDKSEKVAKK